MKVIALSGIIGIQVDPSDVRAALAEANGEDVRIEIGSPGGFVMPGLEIHNMIRQYEGNVEVRLMGLAASMASYIALAADKITAHDNAVYMIHNVLGVSIGDHRELRATADNFEKLTNLLAKAYAKRTGKAIDEIRQMMDDESYFYGDEIEDAGIADEIIKTESGSDKEEACAYAQVEIQNCVKAMKEREEAESDMTRAAAYLEVENFDPMAPYENEHACRLNDPGKYVRFRRKNNAGKVDGKRIDIIIGFKKDGGSEAQAIRYPKNIWKAEDALKDCRERKGKFEASGNDDDCCSLIIKNIIENKSQTQNIEQEVKDMDLETFLNSNPDAKAAYDAKITEAKEAGKVEGEKAAKDRIEKCSAYLSGDYPDTVTNLAIAALKGDEEVATVVGAATVIDAQKEKEKSEAAKKDPANNKNTPPDTPPKVTEDGEVNSEEDFQAEINRAKGGK